MCEEGRLNVEPASENTYTAQQGGRERHDFSKSQEEKNFVIPSLPGS